MNIFQAKAKAGIHNPFLVYTEKSLNTELKDKIKFCRAIARKLQEVLLEIQSILAAKEREFYQKERESNFRIINGLFLSKVDTTLESRMNVFKTMVNQDYQVFQSFARDMDNHFARILDEGLVTAYNDDKAHTPTKAAYFKRDTGAVAAVANLMAFRSPLIKAKIPSASKDDSSIYDLSSEKKPRALDFRSESQKLNERSRKIFRYSQQRQREGGVCKVFDKLFEKWKELKRSQIFRAKTKYLQAISKRKVLIWKKPGYKQITFKLRAHDQLWERRLDDQEWPKFFERLVNFISKQKEERDLRTCNWIVIVNSREFYLE